MKSLYLTSAAFILPAHLSAQAAPQNDPPADTLSEIVVSGTTTCKLHVPRAETPQNVTIINQDLMERINPASVQETLRYIPSVQGELSGRSGLDAALRHDFGRFGAALTVKNLFDKTNFPDGDFRAVIFGERSHVQPTLRAGF